MGNSTTPAWGELNKVISYAFDMYMWQLELYKCKETLFAGVFI